MTEYNKLEAVTVLVFHDVKKEFARTYEGLLNFEEGDIINLVKCSNKMPVSPGNYVIRKRNISNQMGLDLDNKYGSDDIHRFYHCEKL